MNVSLFKRFIYLDSISTEAEELYLRRTHRWFFYFGFALLATVLVVGLGAQGTFFLPFVLGLFLVMSPYFMGLTHMGLRHVSLAYAVEYVAFGGMLCWLAPLQYQQEVFLYFTLIIFMFSVFGNPLAVWLATLVSVFFQILVMVEPANQLLQLGFGGGETAVRIGLTFVAAMFASFFSRWVFRHIIHRNMRPYTYGGTLGIEYAFWVQKYVASGFVVFDTHGAIRGVPSECFREWCTHVYEGSSILKLIAEFTSEDSQLLDELARSLKLARLGEGFSENSLNHIPRWTRSTKGIYQLQFKVIIENPEMCIMTMVRLEPDLMKSELNASDAITVLTEKNEINLEDGPLGICREDLMNLSYQLEAAPVHVLIKGCSPSLTQTSPSHFWDAFSILAQTMYAQGAESAPERLLNSKPECSLVEIEIKDTSSGWIISIQDDGRGVDITRLSEIVGSPVCEENILDSLWLAGRKNYSVNEMTSTDELSHRQMMEGHSFPYKGQWQGQLISNGPAGAKLEIRINKEAY